MADIPEAESLAASLLACPADQRPRWLQAHRGALGLPLIAAIKAHSDQHLLADPRATDDATRCALMAAQACDDPLAHALAAWARGNWEAYHDPQAAVQSYRRAVAGYRAAGDQLSTARLLANLVFAYGECGSFSEAHQAYAEARQLLAALGQPAGMFLLRLEQNYGLLLHNQGHHEQALAAHERALALARQLDQPIVAAEVQVNRTLTLGMFGRLAEGEPALLRERAVAQAHRQALTVARIDMHLGYLTTALGRPADALRHFQQAREQFLALGNQMEVGTVLLLEAALFERIGALREAESHYAQSQAHFAALGMQTQVGAALVHGAAASRRGGTYRRAARLLDQASTLWRELDQPLWQAAVTFERGELALAQHNAAGAQEILARLPPGLDSLVLAAQRDVLLAEAEALRWRLAGGQAARNTARAAFERALAAARQLGDRWLERRALAGLGRLALPDDPATAREFLERAAALDESTRQSLGVEELKASFQAQASDLLPLVAQIAIEQGQPAPALAAIWRAKGAALLDLLLRTGADRPATPADAALDAEIETARQQLATQRWRAALDGLTDIPENLREREDPAVRDLEQRLYALRRRRNAAAAAPPIGDLARLLAQMDADLLIEYVACDDALLAVRADRAGRCQATRLANTAALLDVLEELQLDFENVVAQPPRRRLEHRAAWLAECRPLLGRCYDLLVAPLGRLPPGAKLLIAPCHPLYLLPFAALWDGQRYLAERHQLEMTPSGALLAAPPPRAATGPSLVIAASAGGRLPAVRAEAEAVAAALPSSACLVDDPRSLARLQQQPPPRVLHLAAHSVLRDDAPIFSALALADQPLSVEQCYGLPLRGAELVTLSGCATAAGLESGGALLAFQSAFFVAGARHVLSSLWPVDDQATADWMGLFYRHFAAGPTPAAALQRTQQALLQDPATCHPAIWAAFALSRR